MGPDSATGIDLVEVWRGDRVESRHRGSVVVCRPDGSVVEAWGAPHAPVHPRSAIKPVQALPLVATGAADALGLTSEHLALACASHSGAAVHVELVTAWLAHLGLSADDLACGPQEPADQAERDRLVRASRAPTRAHDTCSGKHAGFATLARHLGVDPATSVDPDGEVQARVAAAVAELTDSPVPLELAVDGCSAPTPVVALSGLATAMARFAAPPTIGSSVLAVAAERLREAMASHPLLVAGSGRACTELITAARGGAVVKTGAEGVYVAVLPEPGVGVAVKIDDGATRAAECVVAEMLVRLGALDGDGPVARRYRRAPVLDRNGAPVGSIVPAPGWSG